MPIFRKLAVKANINTKPTHITSLSRLRSATVVLDSSEAGLQDCINKIRIFFNERNIKADIYVLALNKKVRGLKDCTVIGRLDLSLFGWIARKKKRFDRSAEFYLSLVYPQQWLDYYEALCSGAVFKAARYQTPQETFDFVLTGTEGKSLEDVFDAMSDFLVKIR